MSFRISIFGLALITGVLAAWILAAEILRPRLLGFPANLEIAREQGLQKNAAITVAKYVGLRGDLWATAALSQINALWSVPFDPAAAKSAITDIHADAARSVLLSPHDSMMWLVLAEASWRSGESQNRISELLKMSYYTGPGEFSLMPRRELVGAASNAIEDNELQGLVRSELRTLVTRQPELKSSIETAYRLGTLPAKKILLSTINEIDPAFGQYLQQRQ